MASVNSKETEELWQLRVVDLCAELARRGLNKSGLKHELIERLAKSILGKSSKSWYYYYYLFKNTDIATYVELHLVT